MTELELINRYKQSSLRNLETARDLIKAKHFDWALFLGQLSLEKLLKALTLNMTILSMNFTKQLHWNIRNCGFHI